MSGPLMSAMGLGWGEDSEGDGDGRGAREPRPVAVPRGRATLEEVYLKYRAYKRQRKSDVRVAGGRGGMLVAPMPLPGMQTASDATGDELSALLEPLGYSSISAFEAFLDGFEESFEREAARSAGELLERYARVLHKEAARYRDPAERSRLHQKLGGVRMYHEIFERNASLANDHVANAERSRMPGGGHLRPAAGPSEAQAAHQRAAAAKASAQRELRGLAADHPIFQEDGVPLDRRIDKAALVDADEGALGGLLQAHLATRLRDLAEAKALLEAKPELIYKLDKLFPQLVAEQSIAPGSVFAMILEDKLRDDAISRLTAGILVAMVSIALAAVSLGAATPAIAAGAAVLGVGLSAGMAYQELQEHGEQGELADVGFTEDPSVAWLALAVIGAAVDLGAAARALKVLGPAMQGMSHGGDPAELARVIRAHEQAGQLDARIARAVEKGAAARQGFFEAAGDLRAALMGKAFTFPGPFTDPDVFRNLVRVAKEGMGLVFHRLEDFINHVCLKRLEARLPEMTSEEMVKVREAWEQSATIKASAKSPLEIKEGDELIGRFSYGSQLEIIPRVDREELLHGGNTIKLDPNRTTTVTGTLADTNSVAERGFLTPGVTLMGENLGGINVLRSPQWRAIQEKHRAIKDKSLYWKTVTDEFWETVNKPWLDESVARNDTFRFVSDPHAEEAVFVTQRGKLVLDSSGAKIRSIFGREVDYLSSRGYTFHADGTATRPQ